MVNFYQSVVSSGKQPWRWQNIYDTYIKGYANQLLGYEQAENTKASLQAQIDYEQYLKRGNERALADWHRNVPNRQIRYPELSYAGQIRRADTSIARANFDYATADANYYGNLPYRAAGLYGISTRLFRNL